MSHQLRAVRSAAEQGDDILLRHQLEAIGTRLGLLEAQQLRLVVEVAACTAEFRKVVEGQERIEAQLARVLHALGDA